MLAERAIPPDDAAQMQAMTLPAIAEANRYGLTGIHDAGIGPNELAAYEALARAGQVQPAQLCDDLRRQRHERLPGPTAGARPAARRCTAGISGCARSRSSSTAPWAAAVRPCWSRTPMIPATWDCSGSRRNRSSGSRCARCSRASRCAPTPSATAPIGWRSTSTRPRCARCPRRTIASASSTPSSSRPRRSRASPSWASFPRCRGVTRPATCRGSGTESGRFGSSGPMSGDPCATPA